MSQAPAPFAVVISTYNAFNHLRISQDIIRHNWQPEGLRSVPIVLSCNNPDVEAEVRGLDLTKIVHADASIPWTRDGGVTTDKAGFRARALDCIQTGCQAALEFNTPYVVHTHADGWILSAEKIQEIIAHMKANNQVYAAGGWGLDFPLQRDNIDQVGELDDYFFIFDTAWAKETNFWDFKAKYNDPNLGHPWYLVTRFLERAKPEQLYHYQDYKSGGVEYSGPTPRHVAPWRYDDTYKLLHIDDFVTYRDIVADIFKRNNIAHGQYVKQVLAGQLSWEPKPKVVVHKPLWRRALTTLRQLPARYQAATFSNSSGEPTGKPIATLILNRNLPHVTDALVENLKKYNDEVTDIYVIESGSDPDKLSKYMNFWANWPQARAEGLRIPRGFNFGLLELDKLKRYEYYFLVCGDTVFNNEPTLKILLDLMIKHPKLGIVSPLSPTWGDTAYFTPEETLKFVWLIPHVSWLVRRSFIDEILNTDNPSYMNYFYDGTNFRGFDADTELMIKAYQHDYAVGLTSLTQFHEEEDLTDKNADVMKTERQTEHKALMMAEGLAWMKRKYGFKGKVAMRRWAIREYEAFLRRNPEYKKLRINWT